MTSTAQTSACWLRNDRGQTLVEFAVVLPILMLVLLGIAQFGLAFHNYIGITDAARVGARAAAVHRATACREATAAILSSTDWTISPRITCSPPGGNVGDPFTVWIKYPYKIGLPGFTPMSGDLIARATERLE